MKILNHQMSRILIVCLVGFTLFGCSRMTKPFKSSKNIDMEPFAENTINLITDIKHGIDSNMMVYLREYADEPALQDYRNSWNFYRPVLRGVAAYSIAIVTLSKMNLTEEQRSQRLANFLDELLRPRIDQGVVRLSISAAELDTMTANIRTQKNFLDALGAAQPLVDEIERFSHDYIDVMNDQLYAARAWLDQQVRKDHAASREFYKTTIDAQNLGYNDLVLLRKYRQGYDNGALAELLEKDPQLAEILPSAKNATPEQLQAVEDRVLYRLERIRGLTEQVQPDLQLFRDKIRELDQLSLANSQNLAKTRITVIIWARSHRGLAQGITNPATFDVMGMAKQALRTAMPIP